MSLCAHKAGAAANFERAIQVSPELAWIYLNRGFLRGNEGDTKGAIEDYSRALEIDPANADALCARGRFRDGMGDLEGAIRDFTEAIAVNPNLASAFGSRGISRYKKGDSWRALDDFNKATELEIRLKRPYRNRGLCLPPGPRPGGTSAIIAKPSKRIPLTWKPMAVRAFLCEKLGDYRWALRDYDRAILLLVAGKMWRCHGRRAWANACCGNYAAAAADFARRLEKYPRDYWARCGSGGRLAWPGRLCGCARVNAGIAIYHWSINFYVERAMLRHLQNRDDDALEDLSQAIEYDPRGFRSGASYEFGKMWAGLFWGDSDQTVRFARRYLERASSGDSASLALILGYIGLKREHKNPEALAFLEEWADRLNLVTWPGDLVKGLRAGKSFEELLPLAKNTRTGAEIHTSYMASWIWKQATSKRRGSISFGSWHWVMPPASNIVLQCMG